MSNTKKTYHQLMAILAIPFLLLTACEVQPDESINPSDSDLLSVAAKDNLVTKDLEPLPYSFGVELGKNLNLESKAGRLSPVTLGTDPQYREMVARAINAVEPTECGYTDMDYWLNDELSDWTNASFADADFLAMFDLPTYYALVFENTSSGQYYGKDGEYTQSLTKTFKDLKRFWDIQTDDIVLAAMHGNMLTDRDMVVSTYMAAFGLPEAFASLYADYVEIVLDYYPEYRNGAHPIFTFNAFAQPSFPYPPYGIDGVIPNKIIMGDGILEAYAGLGFEDVAPQAILAHEFGHHIQFQLGLFDSPISDPAEATRRTELMADAYSAYYLSHARGATMQWKRVQQFLEVFFNIGDCGFSSEGHHGTPLQRMAAAEWGYQVANSAKKQGHIMSSEEFTALFEAKLPELVAAPLTVQ